jgi:hypothetical protein
MIIWKLTSQPATQGLAWWNDKEIEIGKGRMCLSAPHSGGGLRVSDLSVLLTARKVRDFTWTWYSECMISERVLELFRAEGVTGFEVKQVTARYKRQVDEEPPQLWELVVKGWGGMAKAESGVKLVESCPDCGRLRYSLFTDGSQLFDPSQWDGSDIFWIWPMPRYYFVTDRVKQLIKANKLTGVTFLAPRDIGTSGFGTFGPGRLSEYLPPGLAHKLGGPLGIE